MTFKKQKGKMMFMPKNYLSATEAAKKYGCSSSAIRSFVRQGVLHWDELALTEFGVRRITKKDFDNFVGSRSDLIESRRANAYAGMPEGYLTINQFSQKYHISPAKLMQAVNGNVLEHRVSDRGWKLLPEGETCQKLKVGEYANGTEINQGDNLQKDKTTG